jgi:pSer/pThr/pTyr-binding forkhead associated (FHA) protein
MPTPFGRLILSLPDDGRQEYSLAKSSITLGRSTTNDIVLPDSKASRNHAALECGPQGCVLADLGSANGTRVNGVRVERASLAPGDVIAIGDCSFRFELSEEEPDPELTRVMPEGDLEATIAAAPMMTELQETAVARLAIYTPARTWEVPLKADHVTLGRHPENDVVLDSPKVSRRHARIERKGDGFVLVDLTSDNGTWLGPEKITRQTLEDGDAIRIGGIRMVFKAALQSEELTVVDQPASAGGPRRRPVVVVPGFAGTYLYNGSEQIWPNPRRVFSQPEILCAEGLEPRGLLHEVVIVPNFIKLDKYSLLVDYLKESLGYESGRDLLEFGYDFRQDVRESARRLAAAIDAWDPGPPITIIAHSMGSLVTRYYVERLGGKKKVERIAFLGGPHSGTPYSFASLLRGPSLLPFGLRNDRLREVLATFPAWFQILPIYRFAYQNGATPLDIFGDPTWLPEERRAMLSYTRDFRAELGTRSSVPAICIFGYGLKTITRATLERAPGELTRKLDLEVTPGGDGTIPEESAVLEGAEIHPVRQYHGAIYVDNDVKMRLKLELTRRVAATAV